MTEHKKFLWTLFSIFSGAFLLVLGVFAHDRGADQAVIDHFFDFHLDMDKVQEQLEEDKFNRDVQAQIQAENDKRREEWTAEVRELWGGNSSRDNDCGTVSPPDHNGNRD